MDLGCGYKKKAQGLYGACSSFEHIFAFSVLSNGLGSLKPLVVIKNFQKRNQYIFKRYYMIDKEFSI